MRRHKYVSSLYYGPLTRSKRTPTWEMIHSHIGVCLCAQIIVTGDETEVGKLNPVTESEAHSHSSKPVSAIYCCYLLPESFLNSRNHLG